MENTTDKNKIALILGITGQDGSYLAELLLEKGYEVHATIRRASTFNTERIDHLIGHERLHLHHGDITDPLNITTLMAEIKPNEIYNLAAQSHVKVSFEVPYYTAQTDALGTLTILEAMRVHCPGSKLYNATTSELYGGLEYNKNEKGFYDENSPFHPRSPYGVAKLYSYWIAKNYRESYGLFACNGILFNHETLAEIMPVVIKKNGVVNIKPISEVVINDLTTTNSFNKDLKTYQEVNPTEEVFVWDKKGWVKILYASGYPHLVNEDNKNPVVINSKNACYFATGSHECIMEDGSDKKFSEIEIGDKVSLVECFEKFENGEYDISEKEAEFLGFTVADGNYKKQEIRLTQKDIKVLEYYENIFIELYGISAKRQVSTSGFTKLKNINQFLFSNKYFTEKFKIYNSFKEKCIPYQILNSNVNIKKAFLRGYYKGDGLKNDKTIYEFKSFKSNSSTLAMGLIYLFKECYNLNYNINCFMHNNKLQYQVNLLSNSKFSLSSSEEKIKIVKSNLDKNKSQREICRLTGISRNFIRKIQKDKDFAETAHHFFKENNEVKKIIKKDDYLGWFFDLTTETGTFHAGVGHGHIHNSPRRGKTFVTRKITTNLVQIKKGKRDVLKIGNLDAERDWGHAAEYCEGMWRMLQQDKPEDFVLATGKTYKVRTFIEMAAKYLDWEIEWKGEGVDEKGYDKSTGKLLVEVDPKYFRPAEVDVLIGDASKAKKILGWEAKIDLEQLVKEMVLNDLKNE